MHFHENPSHEISFTNCQENPYFGTFYENPCIFMKIQAMPEAVGLRRPVRQVLRHACGGAGAVTVVRLKVGHFALQAAADPNLASPDTPRSHADGAH